MNFPGKSFLIDVNCATTFVMDESDFYDKGKSEEKGRSQTRSFLSLIMNCENTVFMKTVGKLRKNCEMRKETGEAIFNSIFILRLRFVVLQLFVFAEERVANEVFIVLFFFLCFSEQSTGSSDSTEKHSGWNEI